MDILNEIDSLELLKIVWNAFKMANANCLAEHDNVGEPSSEFLDFFNSDTTLDN